MAESTHTYSGVGVFGLLGVAFVVLKLTNYIDWSWWWVLAPFWLPYAIIFGIPLVLLAAAGIMLGVAKIIEERRA